MGRRRHHQKPPCPFPLAPRLRNRIRPLHGHGKQVAQSHPGPQKPCGQQTRSGHSVGKVQSTRPLHSCGEPTQLGELPPLWQQVRPPQSAEPRQSEPPAAPAAPARPPDDEPLAPDEPPPSDDEPLVPVPDAPDEPSILPALPPEAPFASPASPPPKPAVPPGLRLPFSELPSDPQPALVAKTSISVQNAQRVDVLVISSPEVLYSCRVCKAVTGAQLTGRPRRDSIAAWDGSPLLFGFGRAWSVSPLRSQ